MRTQLRGMNMKVLAAAATVVGAAVGIGRAESGASHAPAAVHASAPAAVAVSAQAAHQVLAGVGVASDSQAAAVDPAQAKVATALAALGGKVAEQSDPKALKLAFEAYYNYRSAHPENVKKPYLYFVDYGLDSHTPRGYVFDMDALRVVDGPFTVAHGRGSGSKDGVPTRFSNSNNSAASSLGLFLTQEVYGFTGHTGGQPYHSVGLRMTGLSGEFNDMARARRVVVHGAPYVTPTKSGRSEGCPAMELARAQKLIPKIGNGALVFLFSPADKTWMDEDPWANGLASQSRSAD